MSRLRTFFVIAPLLFYSLHLQAHDTKTTDELREIYTGIVTAVMDLKQSVETQSEESPGYRGAFAEAILQFAQLYDQTIKIECPDCSVSIERPRLTLGHAFCATALWPGKQFWRLAYFVYLTVTNPGVSTGKLVGASIEVQQRYGALYAIIWAVATATFEILEHGPLQIHIGCAPFQTAYHTIALSVRNIGAVACHPWSGRDFNRLTAFIPVNYYEILFWWRLSALFNQLPDLIDEHERGKLPEAIRKTTAAIETEIGDRSLPEAIFDGSSDSPALPRALLADLEKIFASDGHERAYYVYQHAHGFTKLHELIKEGLKRQLESKELPLTQYIRAKGLLGTLGRLIDDYKRGLALVGRESHVPESHKKTVARWTLGKIWHLLSDPSLIELSFGSSEVPIGQLLKLWEKAMVTQKTARVRCSYQLAGHQS